MKMLPLLFISLCGSVFSQVSGVCISDIEFSCYNEKECISKLQWCDGVQDCSDGSDEYFCKGSVQCMRGLFRCRNGRCIPNSGRCDGIEHCTDWSDEENCARRLGTFDAKNLTVAQATYENNTKAHQAPIQIKYDSNIEQAVTAAANFLLRQRQADYGWISPVATSRANIALAFAERIRPLPESEKKLMKKQLNIQLSLDLLQRPMKTSLSHLALYINALYATCQDPRSFQGLDLVKLLRTETEKVMSTNFSLPIVLLTLCVVGESDPGNVRMKQIRNIYAISQDRISTQALTFRAWNCMARKRGDPEYYREYLRYLMEFHSKMVNLTDENLDVYSTALYFQVCNAAELKSNASVLMSHQQEDGSFGDLLATYYAIPALINATLTQLSCITPDTHEESTENTFNMHSGGKKVIYSLWIPTETYVNTRTVTVNYGENATFYDIMRMAETKDPTYRFMYDTEDFHKKIYSLADTPNDAETRKSWTLYEATGEVAVNSPQNLQMLRSEVNLIIPKDGAHYIFWLTRDKVPMV